MKTATAVAAALGLLFGIQAVAHHSASAVYNLETRVKTSGTLREVRWINPHIVIVLTADDGKDTQWTYEGNPPSWFKNNGVSRADIAKGLGAKVVIESSPSRVGKPIGYFRQITFGDGTFVRFAEEVK